MMRAMVLCAALAAPAAASVKGHRLWRLGRIDDSGRLRFRVPHAAPGRCRLIAEADDGRHIQASESFRVTRAS
jgi:hypothetical protein